MSQLLKKSLSIICLILALISSRFCFAAPDTLIQLVTYNNETITLRLTRENIRGANFELLAQNEAGSYDTITPVAERSYIGTVDEYSAAVSYGILQDDGIFKGGVIFDRGDDWYILNNAVTSTTTISQPNSFSYTPQTVLPGQAGLSVYGFDVGIDARYEYFNERGSGSISKTLETIEYSLTQNRALYLHDALLRPFLARVIVRTDPTQDPASGLTGGNYLDAVKNEWNTNQTDANRDVVAGVSTSHVSAGLAWTGVIGTNDAYSVNDSQSDGNFNKVWQHELGHNWGLSHYDGGAPEGGTINSNNHFSRMSGPELRNIFNHRDSKLNILDNLGVMATVNIPPYASYDSATFTQVIDNQIIINVLANDHDANGHTLSVVSFDSTTVNGGTVVQQGQNLVYKASGFFFGTDSFTYKVQDSSGQTATGAVAVKVNLNDKMRAYLPLDETLGSELTNEASSSGSGFVQGGATIGVEGKFGNAVSFDGVNDQIRLNDLDLYSNTVTLSGWIKRPSASQNAFAGIIFNGAGLNFGSNNELRYHWNGTNWGWNSGLIPPAGQWVFVALVIEPIQATIYMHDGIALQSATHVGVHTAEEFAGVTSIGGDPARGDRNYTGDIDDVRIYDQVLTQAQILDLVSGSRADSPLPFSGASGVYTGNLSWAQGATATAYEVYIGTNQTVVTNATTESLEYQGTTASTNWLYNALPNTTYYWRVDTVTSTTTIPGTVWSFTTGGKLFEHDLASLWKLDEGDGPTAIDSLPNGSDGALNGPIWTDGIDNKALSFDGLDDFVDFDNGPSLSGQTNFTVSAWVKTSASTRQVILQQRCKAIAGGTNGWNGEYQLRLDADGKIAFWIYGNWAYQFQILADVNAADGVWHNITAVRNGESGFIYMDGELVGEGTGPCRDLSPDIKVAVGADTRGDADYFEGVIDEVKIYTRALTGPEVSVLAINPNHNPVAVNDNVTIDEDTFTNIDVIANDTDADLNTLTVESITQASNGDVTINGTTIDYTPHADFNGVDSFTYSITDGIATDIATVTITVNPINDAPVAVDDTVSTVENTTVSFAVLANDTDIELDTLVIQSVTQGTNGTVSVNGTTVDYTPVIDFIGEDSFTYTIIDSNGGVDTATVFITVESKLVARWTFDEGTGISAIDSSGNGFDGVIAGAVYENGRDGKCLRFEGVDYVTLPKETFEGIVTEVTFSFWSYGDSTYMPEETCIINANDVAGNRIFNIHLPWSNESIYFDCGNSGATYDRIGKVALPSEYEGQWKHWVFTKDAVRGEMKIYLNGALWHSGTDKLNPLGTVEAVKIGASARRNCSYDGMIDDFRIYRTSLSDTEVSDLYNSYPENTAPVAENDIAVSDEGSAVVVTVLANDIDNENDALIVNSVTQGANGIVTTDGTVVTYTPNSGFAGNDTFTYTCTDGHGGADTASVTVTVKGIIAHWQFDEGLGTIANDSTNTAHGSITDESWSEGVHDKALAFNGISTKVSCGTAASLEGKVDFTLSAWIKTSATEAGVIIQQRDQLGYQGEYKFNMNNNGNLQFIVYKNGYQFNFATTMAVNDGEWHHVVAQRDGVTGRIFIDAVEAGSHTGSEIKLLVPTLQVAIGADIRDNKNFFNGLIDDVRIYNHSLSLAEIAQLSVKPDTDGDGISDIDEIIAGFDPLEYSFEGDSPDEFGVHTVTNLTMLDLVKLNLDGDYKLGADVDLSLIPETRSSSEYVPIGSSTEPFTGTFDGAGYTISNLIIDSPADDYVGYLGYCENAVIKNLVLNDVNITGYSYVGGIVGYAKNCSITNCSISGNVEGINYTGGIAGYITSQSTMSNSYSTATVRGANKTGGLVGYMNSSAISEAHSTGSTSGTDMDTGGLVGYCYNSSNVSKSYSTGQVFGSNAGVGGIIGKAYLSCTINECYSTGWIIGNEYVGGLVGIHQNQCSITNCYTTGDINAGDYTGGLTSTTYDNSTIENSYSTSFIHASTSVGCVGGVTGFTGLGSTVNNNYALNDKILGYRATQRVIGREDISSPHTTASNNYAFAGMQITTDFWNDNVFHCGVDISRLGMTTEESYTNNHWDFTNTWQIVPYSLPILKWNAYPSNNPPVANDDTIKIDYNNSCKLALIDGDNYTGLAADTDPDGDELYIVEITNLTWSGNPALTSGQVTIDLEDEGIISYVHEPGYTGIIAFNYTIVDLKGGYHTALATINVEDNTPPVITLNEGGAKNLDPSKNSEDCIILQNSTFVDTQGTVLDEIDGIIPWGSVNSSTIDTNTAYPEGIAITYTVADLAGNTGNAIRTLYVLSPTEDQDNDGLTNEQEINIYGSNPYDEDSDNDGVLDGVEVAHNTDTNIHNGDNMPLGWMATVIGGPSETDLVTFDYETNSSRFLITRAKYENDRAMSDNFGYIYKTMNGDFSAKIKIEPLSLRTWGNLSLMVRDSIEPESPYVAALGTFERGVAIQYRAEKGSWDKHLLSSDEYTPCWMLLIRKANIVTNYVSMDNIRWKKLSSVAVDLEDDVKIGMAATAGDSTKSTWGYFSNIEIDALTDDNMNGINDIEENILIHDEVQAKVIYVDGSLGDDTNDGKLMEHKSDHGPLLTIGKAIELAPSGSTIYLKEGEYNQTNQITIDGKKLELMSYSGEVIVNVIDEGITFSLVNGADVVINGIDFKSTDTELDILNNTGNPVILSDDSSLRVINSSFIGNHFAKIKAINTSQLYFINSTIAGDFYYGIYGNYSTVKVTNSTFERGIHSILPIDSVGNDEPLVAISAAITSLDCDSSRSLQVLNSLIKTPLGIRTDSPTEVIHCTLTGDSSHSIYNGGTINYQSSIIWTENYDLLGIDWEFFKNSTYTTEKSTTATYCNIKQSFEGEGNISQNPSFVDINNEDYHLQSDSPCIDSAKIVTYDMWEDIDAEPRAFPVSGGIPDMGCYEYTEQVTLTIKLDNGDIIETKTFYKGEDYFIEPLISNEVNGVRYTSDEWEGTGSITPGTVQPNSLERITIEEDSELTWINTQKQYKLSMFIIGEGGVNNKEWYNEGEVVSLNASPSQGFVLDRWAGHLRGWDNTINFVINDPLTGYAVFREDFSNGASSESGTVGPYYLTVLPGWNLLSSPVQPINSSIDEILGDFRNSMMIYGWNKEGGYYFNATELIPLEGLWVFSYDGKKIDIPVIGNLLESFNYEVVSGWNLLGVPYKQDQLSFERNSSIKLQTAWSWDNIQGAYYHPTSVYDGSAYWLHRTSSESVKLGDINHQDKSSIWNENKTYIINSFPSNNDIVTTLPNGTIEVVIRFNHPCPDGSLKIFDKENNDITNEVTINSDTISFTIDEVNNGAYSYSITYYDEQGNEIATEYYNFIVDTLKPITTVDNKSGYYDRDVDITFSCSKNADIYYSTDGIPPEIGAPNTSKIKNLVVAFEEVADSPVINIKPENGGVIHLQFFAVDNAGNREDLKSEVYRFTVSPEPTVLSALLLSNGQPKLIWDTVDGQLEFNVYKCTNIVDRMILENSRTGKLPPPKNFLLDNVTVSNSYLDDTGVYGGDYTYYAVTVVDVNGNESIISNILSKRFGSYAPNPEDTSQAINKAESWLMGQINENGSWGDKENLKLLYTSEILNYFSTTDSKEYPLYKALYWMRGFYKNDCDTVARITNTLNLWKLDTSFFQFKLYAEGHRKSTENNQQRQWGLSWEYAPDPLDTALSIQAFKSSTNNSLINTGWDWDGDFVNEASGYSINGSVELDVSMSTFIYNLKGNNNLKDYTWLKQLQNLDTNSSDFGQFNGSLLDTAAVVRWMIATEPDDVTILENAVKYIIRNQRSYGDWDSNIYTTIMCLNALNNYNNN